MRREIISEAAWERVLEAALDDDHRAELRDWRRREAAEVLEEWRREAERVRVTREIALRAGSG
jgi:hypothetical protein